MEEPEEVKRPVRDIGKCNEWQGHPCAKCFDACPKKDVAMQKIDGKIVINYASCDGCMKCVHACECGALEAKNIVIQKWRNGDGLRINKEKVDGRNSRTRS